MKAALVLAAWGLTGIQASAQEEPPDDFADRPAVERSNADLLLEVLSELATLREEVRRLHESMDTFQANAIRQLQEENRSLRRAVPGRAEEAAPDYSGLVPGADEPRQHEEPGKFEYTVVKEWGRSPEDAAAFGNGAVSLKGMLVAVPEWSSDEQIIDLGRTFRRQFDPYDNINIEIYKNVESALMYAERGTTNPDDRVMSISRFKQEGRDVILLIRGNDIHDIPVEGADAPPDPGAAEPEGPAGETPASPASPAEVPETESPEPQAPAPEEAPPGPGI